MGELMFTFAYGGGLIVIGLFTKYMLTRGETKKEKVHSFAEAQKVVTK